MNGISLASLKFNRQRHLLCFTNDKAYNKPSSKKARTRQCKLVFKSHIAPAARPLGTSRAYRASTSKAARGVVTGIDKSEHSRRMDLFQLSGFDNKVVAYRKVGVVPYYCSARAYLLMCEPSEQSA
ncbi:hypothetical protein EVAR_98572_1 [Eumeta japonica]|uniref:Uncharacterized protein n=1 Tax=Eumeta variegata TaxID=151549 RepID=A0A4C1YWC3_EUMVA|nr:hypothetical protein EVAR_98572_1 [Eumeta japonica]